MTVPESGCNRLPGRIAIHVVVDAQCSVDSRRCARLGMRASFRPLRRFGVRLEIPIKATPPSSSMMIVSA